MNALHNLRIGARLALAFSAIIVLALVVGVIGVRHLSALKDDLRRIGNDRVPKVQQLVAVTDDVNLIARELRNAILFGDNQQVQASVETVLAARAQIAKTLDALAPTITSDEGLKRLAALTAARASYMPAQERFIGMIRAGDKVRATGLLETELRPAQLAYIQALDELRNLQVDLITQSVQASEAEYVQAQWQMFMLLAAMAAIGAALAWWITGSITGPIHSAVDVAEKVAAGDLSSRFDVTRQDETGRLLGALKAMNDGLVGIVSTVRNSSDIIATGSAQIAIGNADLSQRTEDQASALEQTAASMEQLGSTVRQTADNARQANQLAMRASSMAIQGGEVVKQVVGTMQGINDSSQRVADIIGVIDGIAFQTNILALNAAVEAARAGEQGRGFAVVASEVRSLAQRSAEAAKEIKRLISANVERVEQGTVLVDQAGVTMNDVVNSIQRVTDIMGEISSASSEQSQGVSQVCETVTQMDHVTQQNAALVEESAAAAESLRDQAQKLVGVVAVFRIGGRAMATTAGAASAHASTPADKPAAASSRADRRRPDRARTVIRPHVGKAKPAAAATAPKAASAPAPAKTGTDDWEQF